MKRTLYASAAALALGAHGAQAQDLVFTPGEGAFNWQSYDDFAASHDLAGQSLNIFGPWRGEDQRLFENLAAYFEAATGADLNYSSSETYEQQIVIDLEGGSPPDVAILPQPGLIQNLISRGFVAPLGADTRAWLVENYAAGESWAGIGTFTGPDGAEDLYAFPFKADVKSLVWYSPDNFEDFGYEIPATQEELRALEAQIIADGGTPWCIGLGSGGATGWPATDWIEDLMLRAYPPEVYDQWVANEIPFTDERVIAVMEQFGEIARNPEMVVGGPSGVASTDFRDSPAGLFSSPPQCFMHRQASFIPTFFPDGTEVGADADFFYFPPSDAVDLGNPVLGAGTLAFITQDTDAARAFLDFLQTPIAHEIWMAQSGFLTPHSGVNTDLFGDPTLRQMNDILLNATTFRFDASDLMPAGVGAGSFWTGMIDFVGGRPAAEVAQEIQNSWDALR
ncbi:ABC transporter substrate-binding protein [Roseicyclus mahoneyensis]|uniref:Maltose-binding protein /trehalose-binding protein /sucrose-binding protein n=1 Tax=Roseicyclus mahoneyensis TaxID=164332 RepID=A0A316GN52_9RHOB|nr:ABC transporter substrate-binding protein [Roseicyclus mahoneyensis]PWK62607.1 maltose-binding protein /trehalose-binding protein /sucrose-binding protein [Roseicyclus mahoneyensis]